MTYKIIKQSAIDKLLSEIKDLRDTLSDTRYDDEQWYKIKQEHLSFLEDLYFEMTGDIKTAYGGDASTEPNELICTVDSITILTKHKLAEPDMNTVDGLNNVYLHMEIPTNKVRQISVSGNPASDIDKDNILTTVHSIDNMLKWAKIELPKQITSQ